MTHTVPLSEVLVTIAQGVPTQRYEDPQGEPFRLVQARQMDALYVDGELPMVHLKGERLDRFQLSAATVLVAIRTWPLKASVVGENTAGALAGPNVAVLQPTTEVEPVYLAGLLRSDFMAARIGVRQAVTGQPTLSLKELQAQPILVPPLETQRALVQLLLDREHADALARQSIEQRHRVVEAALQRTLTH